MSGALQSSAFPTNYTPLQQILGSYLYWQYSDDEDLQAFVAAFNALAQSYLDWFNQTPLAVYTSDGISGLLLDWIGLGIYGIARPVLSTNATSVRGAYAQNAYATLAYATLQYTASGTASLSTDDIYKRVLTWHLYRGDGQQFSIFWLKRRIARFLLGVNGSDADVLSNPPSVSVSGSTYTVTVAPSTSATALQELINNGEMALPAQYTFVIAT